MAFKIKTIEKNNLVSAAYNQILRMVSMGEFRPGDKLPSESKLCESLGVSRDTVRTALAHLVALGLIEPKQGFGYCIRDTSIGVYLNSMLPTMVINAKDIETITEFRIGVESEAAALAALRATPEQIEAMRITCEKSSQAIGDDDDTYAKYDMQFHMDVAVGSQNVLFIKAAEMLENMYTVWLMGFQRTHGKDTSHKYHYNIYRSIAAHDAESAKRYMQEHMTDVLNKVKLDNSRIAAIKKDD